MRHAAATLVFLCLSTWCSHCTDGRGLYKKSSVDAEADSASSGQSLAGSNSYQLNSTAEGASTSNELATDPSHPQVIVAYGVQPNEEQLSKTAMIMNQTDKLVNHLSALESLSDAVQKESAKTRSLTESNNRRSRTLFRRLMSYTDKLLQKQEVDSPPAHWTQWSECSVSCGHGGVNERRRKCRLHCEPQHSAERQTRPCQVASLCRDAKSHIAHHSHHGSDAEYDVADSRGVSDHTDQVHPSYTAWTHWGPCSGQCGAGIRERYRLCLNTEGGDDLDRGQAPCPPESLVQRVECTEPSCPEGVEHSKVRQVAGGGEDFYYQENEDQQRNIQVPALEHHDPTWSAWSHWSQCSTTCSDAVKVKYRTCHHRRNEGRTCEGKPVSVVNCHLPSCLEKVVSVRTLQSKENDTSKDISVNIGIVNNNRRQRPYDDDYENELIAHEQQHTPHMVETRMKCPFIVADQARPDQVYWVTPDGERIYPNTAHPSMKHERGSLVVKHAANVTLDPSTYKCVTEGDAGVELVSRAISQGLVTTFLLCSLTAPGAIGSDVHWLDPAGGMIDPTADNKYRIVNGNLYITGPNTVQADGYTCVPNTHPGPMTAQAIEVDKPLGHPLPHHGQGHYSQELSIEHIDPCGRRPCLNGAVCRALHSGTYTCNCLEGYEGHDCDLRQIEQGFSGFAIGLIVVTVLVDVFFLTLFAVEMFRNKSRFSDWFEKKGQGDRGGKGPGKKASNSPIKGKPSQTHPANHGDSPHKQRSHSQSSIGSKASRSRTPSVRKRPSRAGSHTGGSRSSLSRGSLLLDGRKGGSRSRLGSRSRMGSKSHRRSPSPLGLQVPKSKSRLSKQKSHPSKVKLWLDASRGGSVPWHNKKSSHGGSRSRLGPKPSRQGPHGSPSRIGAKGSHSGGSGSSALSQVVQGNLGGLKGKKQMLLSPTMITKTPSSANKPGPPGLKRRSSTTRQSGTGISRTPSRASPSRGQAPSLNKSGSELRRSVSGGPSGVSKRPSSISSRRPSSIGVPISSKRQPSMNVISATPTGPSGPKRTPSSASPFSGPRAPSKAVIGNVMAKRASQIGPQKSSQGTKPSNIASRKSSLGRQPSQLTPRTKSQLKAPSKNASNNVNNSGIAYDRNGAAELKEAPKPMSHLQKLKKILNQRKEASRHAPLLRSCPPSVEKLERHK